MDARKDYRLMTITNIFSPPIAYHSNMHHMNSDAECLIHCKCGKNYQVWATTREEMYRLINGSNTENAHDIEIKDNGFINVFKIVCPFCDRPPTERTGYSTHSGGWFNAGVSGM